MQGNTHRMGGVCAALGAYIIADNNGLLLTGVTPALQLAVIYPFSMWSSTASDLDHHKGSIPSRDPASMLIYHALHLGKKPAEMLEKRPGGKKTFAYKFFNLFNAKHRAWQTHSDLALAVIIGTLWLTVYSQWAIFSGTDASIAALILTGIACGLVAHIVLDGITPEGIWIMPMVWIKKLTGNKHIKEKWGLVPGGKFFTTEIKKDPKTGQTKTVKKDFFATGNKWETHIVNPLLKFSGMAMMLYIIYTWLPWKLELNLPVLGIG